MFLQRNMRLLEKDLLYRVSLQNEPERYRGVIEIHKTQKGKVMVVGYVDQGSVARVVDTTSSYSTSYTGMISCLSASCGHSWEG